ncbi:hypothetical protein GGR56DRAFT_56141 [Xylariaceae sp. FL0804]|nr:hypothetical protein GGR56DRAFT_56141 [Xylariaceae sp. FL0804]
MRFTLASLAALLLACTTPLASATPTLESRKLDRPPGIQEVCGYFCETDADCTGACHICRQPPKQRWGCVSPDQL